MSGLAAAGQAAAPRLIVGEPWVRGTVEGQTGSGAYMRLTSREDLRIVGASSPAANKVEIHEMRMVDNRMTMRAVPSLALPANATVALEHGYHIMLIGLSQRLEVGQTVKITLHLIDAKGMPFDFDVLAPVRALNASSRRE
jgi:copper(I)-binding protein